MVNAEDFHRGGASKCRWCASAVSAVWILAQLTGCGPGPFDRSVQHRPLHADLATYRAPPLMADRSAAERPSQTSRKGPPSGPLTLRDALSAALLHHPDFTSASWAVRAREAEALQAALPPNPELELEVADFGGTGETAGFDVMETTFSLVQEIEVGGDREARRSMARRDRDLANWDYQIKRLEIISQTRRRFLKVLLSEQNLELMRRERELATPDDPEDQTQEQDPDAALRRMQAQLDWKRAQAERTLAARSLATMWDASEPTFDTIVGRVADVRPVPSLKRLIPSLDQHPQVARWEAEIDRHRAAGRLARAEAIPNIEGRVGGVYIRETDDYSLEVEIAVPLPLFDRRQGKELAARMEAVRAAHQRQATRARLREQLEQAHLELTLAAEEVRALQNDVIPLAEAAAERTADDPRQPREAVAAERRLLEFRRRKLESLGTYHRALIRIEELIGRRIGSVSVPEESQR